MPRSCLCSRLIARATSDAAFRLLPDSARLLWFEILAHALAAPTPGRLRFLDPVSASVSRLVSRPETDVETDLETLARLDLVERDADGCTLWLPGVREGAAKAEAARRNGSNGGRPRKGETAQQMRERRQGEMLLSMPGGAAPAAPEPAVPKPTETEPRNPLACATTTASSLQVSGGSQSAPPAREAAPPWVSLGAELAEIAGLDPARGGYNFRPVQGWLDAGRSPDTIRAAVRRVAERPGYDPRVVHSLGYFSRAVADEAEAPPPPAPRTREDIAAERAWLEEQDRINEAVIAGHVPPRRAA